MKVYMVEGYDLRTGNQGIIDYILAENESEACMKFERYNEECEANEILDEYEVNSFVDWILDEYTAEDFLSNISNAEHRKEFAKLFMLDGR